MKHRDTDAIFKVVSAPELEAATKEGWCLVETLQESTPQDYSSQEMLPPLNGSFVMSPMSVQKAAIVRKHVFLLRKGTETALAQSEARAVAAEALCQAANERVQIAEKQVADTQAIQKANIETFQKEHARLTEQLQSTNRTLTEYVERASTTKDDLNEKDRQIKELSQHLAKVWAALGQLQMERILGTDAVNPEQEGAPRMTVANHLMSSEDD